MMEESDVVERNILKRKILNNFSRLRFVMNDPDGETRCKSKLKDSMVSYCQDANSNSKQILLDCVVSFEKLFV